MVKHAVTARGWMFAVTAGRGRDLVDLLSVAVVRSLASNVDLSPLAALTQRVTIRV